MKIFTTEADATVLCHDCKEPEYVRAMHETTRPGKGRVYVCHKCHEAHEAKLAEEERDNALPKEGETWLMRGLGPWGHQDGRTPATIRDCKDGWVRYALGAAFPDERMKLTHFCSIYQKEG